ncbi:uncharacterized protein isoform X1 [Leptinotarsa decemlineata]|uniref:uncharacterized protein isoform X1 n=1 Tax=Leptinotarsa decemlineata TaxID=7539 RepID=UPI003D3042B3
MKPEIKSFFQALQPKYFDLFIQATQKVARYDSATNAYEVPSFAMNIVNSFKQCCDIAINFVLKGGESVSSAEDVSQLRTMIHLFTANWKYEVSSQAANSLHLNKWNKITIVPLASDLKVLKQYLIDSAKRATEKLNTNNLDAIAYNLLVETIYCRVLLLNRRRPGELQRMLLQTYLTCGNENGHYEEFESIITVSERLLLKKLKRVVIKGKRGRGVPVLFSDDVQKDIQLMVEIRPTIVPQENVFLFAKANIKTEISGYKVIKKHARLSGAKNPDSITATRLRKHLATLMQIFNMTDGDIEQLATFMGHTSGIHRGSYRLPDDIYQTAKLSKLLLLMEKGESKKYKGKSLDEIDFDMEENLIDENDDSEMESEGEVGNDDFQKGFVKDQVVKDGNSSKGASEKKTVTNRKKRILIPWTETQRTLAKKFSKNHIDSSKSPKRYECEELIEKHPKTFEDKTWVKIKVFIQNEYMKNKRC